MLSNDKLMHKYYERKLAPNIGSEKINRPDMLNQQEIPGMEAR
jgi:hypothetical protein